MRLLLLLLFALPALAAPTPESLTKAVRQGNVQKVQALLSKNPSLVGSREPKFGSTPLHTAVAKHQVAIVKLLLQSGADVNVGNDLKMTGLHLCAQLNYAELAELLLAHGADPNVRTKTGITPLRLAVANRNEGVARLIRARGGRE